MKNSVNNKPRWASSQGVFRWAVKIDWLMTLMTIFILRTCVRQISLLAD